MKISVFIFSNRLSLLTTAVIVVSSVTFCKPSFTYLLQGITLWLMSVNCLEGLLFEQRRCILYNSRELMLKGNVLYHVIICLVTLTNGSKSSWRIWVTDRQLVSFLYTCRHQNFSIESPPQTSQSLIGAVACCVGPVLLFLHDLCLNHARWQTNPLGCVCHMRQSSSASCDLDYPPKEPLNKTRRKSTTPV